MARQYYEGVSLLTKLKTKTEQVVVVTHKVCNSCGLKVDAEDWCKAQSFANFKLSFGYGSKYDTDIHRFHLCETCYDKMLEVMKITPDKSEYMVMDGREIGVYPPAPTTEPECPECTQDKIGDGH